MIEQSTTQYYLLIPIVSLLGLSLVLCFKTENSKIIWSFSIAALCFLPVFGYYQMTSYADWNTAFENELNISSCDDLIKNYKLYDGYTKQEEIKAQYIFKCVADKESLELLP